LGGIPAETAEFVLKTPLFCLRHVIQGWLEEPNPESRDSGFGPADRPGM